LDQPIKARPPLRQHLDVDVAIVGGGFTGLWTARELLRRDATLRVAILEKEVCGHGASGRNGGWASALFPISDRALVERLGVSEFNELRRTLQNAVANLGDCMREDDIDAQFAHGGSLIFARSDVQVARLRARVWSKQ
jgi:glycine/D-amino acid oxidase-like deaminating enzyme